MTSNHRHAEASLTQLRFLRSTVYPSFKGISIQTCGMGCWDELCPLSGIRNGGGPKRIGLSAGLGADNTISAMAEEMKACEQSHEELVSIISEALTYTRQSRDFHPLGEYGQWWMPEGLESWNGFTRCIAIGYFNAEYGECPLKTRRAGQKGTFFPSGCRVAVRGVKSGDSGHFEVVDNFGGTDDLTQSRSQCSARAGQNPNFFVLEVCYRYLEEWAMRVIGPRPDHLPELSFAGEFYEIVNSQTEMRSE